MHVPYRWPIVIAALTVWLACDDDPQDPGDGPPPEYGYELVPAFPELTFTRPVDIRHAGDGSDRLFVVEQTGRVLVFANDAEVDATDEFLDITGRVTYINQGEMGLLGLVFHPDYETNGFFFVYYTTTLAGLDYSRLSRFRVTGDPNAADPNSEDVLLEFRQRQANHNGGGLTFGGDGYLYLALGDEGGGGDLYDNAQNRSVVYGKVLRLDVDQNVDVEPYYGIPPDNPYADNASGFREEIFAYGLRNPWRISYDAETDRLWVGDVGQAAYEEIDVIVSGGNYGWDCREGLHAYNGPPGGPSPLCGAAGPFVNPVWEYPRSEGQSITGGHVYRGPGLPSLTGKYVYADFIQGAVWALSIDGGVVNTPLIAPSSLFFISTFGVAEDGELLLTRYFSDGAPGSLYRLREVPLEENE